jgi:hypothetical protein
MNVDLDQRHIDIILEALKYAKRGIEDGDAPSDLRRQKVSEIEAISLRLSAACR